jgi:hypothetical protein
VTDTSDNSARPSKEHPLVDGERFTTAWIDIAKFPGGMMMSSHGGKFGPVPATTGCSITTSPLIADEWRARGSPVIEIQLTSAETPEQPSRGLLMSMAIRLDHGLGVPGYYDQDIFGSNAPTHQQRLDAAITTARQMWEEVVGRGFYRPEKDAEYAARFYAAHALKADEQP